MRIVSKGLVFDPARDSSWMLTHAQTPLLEDTGDGGARIYFGTRDADNRTVTTFIETDATDLAHVRYVHPRPALGLGAPGCFDDCGAMPSWIAVVEGVARLYYTGWNVGSTVPYRNAIGVAVRDRTNHEFSKLFAGPILDRTPHEAFFCATPCVVADVGRWHMWYLSCTEWRRYKDHMEPFYDIKYAHSVDGLRWQRDAGVAIALSNAEEAGLARPSVLLDGGIYRMWYSYRGYRDHREDAATSYKIGYAESDDALHWTRQDDEVEFITSGEGWDDMMQAYPFVYRRNGRLFMLYNGNGFGAGGFGYAEIVD
jgi:hypothetical protein